METEHDSQFKSDLVSASRAVYALNGFSVFSRSEGDVETVDFWATPPASDVRVAIRVMPGDGISKDEVSNTFSQLADGELLHFITDGSFDSDVSSLIDETSDITLIDGSRTIRTMAALPDLIERLGFVEKPDAAEPPFLSQELVEAPEKKSSLPTLLLIVGVSCLAVLVFSGIVAAIAMPNIERFNDAADDSRDRRNAQNFASVFSAARGAGLDFTEDGKALLPTLDAIRKGATIDQDGPFKDTYFGIPEILPDEIEAASKYLVLQDGYLHYVPDENARNNLAARKELKKKQPARDEQKPPSTQKELVAVEARKEASEIVRFMGEAKYRRSTDYMQIAGSDKDTAIQLLMSTIRNFLTRTNPQELPEFDRRYSEDSEILFFAKQFLKVEGGALVVLEDDSAYDKAFQAYVMNDRQVPSIISE